MDVFADLVRAGEKGGKNPPARDSLNGISRLSSPTRRILDSLPGRNDSSTPSDREDESPEDSASEAAGAEIENRAQEDDDSGNETDSTEDMIGWAESDNPRIAMLESHLRRLPTDFDVGGYRMSLQRQLTMLRRRESEEPGSLKDQGEKLRVHLASTLRRKDAIDSIRYHEIVGVLELACPPQYPQDRPLSRLFNRPAWAHREPAERLEGWALYDPQLADPLNPLRHARAGEYWEICDPDCKKSCNPRNLQLRSPQKASTPRNQSAYVEDSPEAQLLREMQQVPYNPQHIATSPNLFLTQRIEGGRHRAPQERDSSSPLADRLRPEQSRIRTAKGVEWDTEGPKAKRTRGSNPTQKRKALFDRQQVKKRR